MHQAVQIIIVNRCGLAAFFPRDCFAGVLVCRAGEHGLRAIGAADAQLENAAAGHRVIENQNRFIGVDGQVRVIKPVRGAA